MGSRCPGHRRARTALYQNSWSLTPGLARRGADLIRWRSFEEPAMPIPLRADFDAARLRGAARASKDAGQTRRLLALPGIYEGTSRSEAAGIGGVTLQIVRDWVIKLNAHGPDS